MKALWLPYVVTDLATARGFYTDHIGLSEVDSWEHPHERGSVLRVAAGAVIELVEAVGRGPAPGPGPPGLRSGGSEATGVTREGGASAGPGARASGASASLAPPPLAFEVDGVRAVDAYAYRLDGTPHRYPRGHYGFEVPGPAGATIMIWSEQ